MSGRAVKGSEWHALGYAEGIAFQAQRMRDWVTLTRAEVKASRELQAWERQQALLWLDHFSAALAGGGG